jgi:hypothetical protein
MMVKMKGYIQSLRNRKATLLLSVALLAGCDTNEQDADSALSINNAPVYFNSNSGGGFIDLTSRIVTPGKVRIEVTNLTSKGSLADIGKGLLHYCPFQGNSLKDSFRFSIFDANDKMMDSDTIGIIVQTDSTKLPCAIYTHNDYRYDVKAPITVDVLANDVICKGTPILSIHQPESSFPPYSGTATVVNNKIVYTPGPSYSGVDKVIYKVTSSDSEIAPAFGMLYLSGSAKCTPVLNHDEFKTEDKFSRNLKVSIDALGNDQACDASLSQFAIWKAPLYGKAEFVFGKLVYTAPDTIRQYPFMDQLSYSLKYGGETYVALVFVRAGVSLQPCELKANPDIFDLSQNAIDPSFLDVLYNDQKCDSVETLTITRPPKTGTAKVTYTGRKLVQYWRTSNLQVNDSLEYTICGPTGSCSTAKVLIKRKP